MKTTQETEITLFNSQKDSKLYQFRLELEKIRDELIEFGLTKNQANVFMYLGKYGPCASRQVCEGLHLPRTETYNILNSLLKIGIVVSEFQHPTRYSALPMNKAITTMVHAAQEKVNHLAKKEIKLAKIWNGIPSNAEKSELLSEKFQMLEGENRINNKIKEMISNARYEFKILCSEKDLFRFYYADLIDILANSSKDIKLIVSPNQKLPHYVRAISEESIRILPNSKIDNQCFIIKDNGEVLIFLRNSDKIKNNCAIWTDTISLVRSMNSLFEHSWQSSLPMSFKKYIENQFD